MENRNNLILNFTHTYNREMCLMEGGGENFYFLDCSDIEGTDMYCTEEAEQELKNRLKQYPISGVHFLDSGNYHYMTRLFTQRIQEPYNLVLFDNHNDMQLTMIPELMSCGGWAKQVVEEDPNLSRLILIGPKQKTIDEIQVSRPEKLVCISMEELTGPNMQNISIMDIIWEKGQEINRDISVYLSIDKDVLSEEYARTNWDQGGMTMPMLKGMLREIIRHSRILGADICGEFPDAPSWQAAEVRHINDRANGELYACLIE